MLLGRIRNVRILLLLCAVCHLILAFPTQTPFAYDNVQSPQVNIPHSDLVFAPLGGSISIPCFVSLFSTSTTSSSSPVIPRVKWSVVSGGVEKPILVARGERVKVNKEYKDRAALLNHTSSPDDLSLWLGDLLSSDSGHYRCEVQQGLEDTSNLVELKVKGVVFHYRDALSRYAFSFHRAQKACEAIGAVIATADQLLAAYNDGYEQCDAGWLADQSVRYPIQVPREGCYGDMDGQPGVRNYGTMDPDDLFDVYCYMEQLDGEVIHDPIPQQLSFAEAQAYCRAAGTELATTAQLYLAWSEGLDRCSPGWLSDGSVRYPITTPRERCGGPQAGVKTLYRFSNQTGFPEPSSLHDVYCFKDNREVTTDSPMDYMATEPEEFGQDVVILTETDEELRLNQLAEQVEREAQSLLESFPFVSQLSTEESLADTHPTVISETTSPNTTSTVDVPKPFDETSSLTEISSAALMNSTSSSTETYNFPQNTSLLPSVYNETDSHQNLSFLFNQFELENATGSEPSDEPHTHNWTELDTNPEEHTQPSERPMVSQEIQETNLASNYSKTESNHTQEDNVLEVTSVTPDTILQVKTEEAAVAGPWQMSLSTQSTEVGELQTTQAPTKNLTSLWLPLDGSGDTSQENDLDTEAISFIPTSDSSTSSSTTHPSPSTSASSSPADHQTVLSGPTSSPGSLSFSILSTVAQLWDSSTSKQEGSTSLETEDTVTTESEEKQLDPTVAEDNLGGSSVTTESPEGSNTSQLPLDSTTAQYQTSSHRVYLNIGTTANEEASGEEPEAVTAVLGENGKVAPAPEENITVSQIHEEEIKVSPSFEEGAKFSFSMEQEVKVSRTLVEDITIIPNFENEVKASPTLEEETEVSFSLEEEVTVVPTHEEETNSASTFEEEEDKANLAPALEEEATFAPTFEEAPVTTNLDDVDVSNEVEANVTSTIEEEANIASGLEDVTAASTLEEDVTVASTLEEDVTAASTTEEDVTAAATIEEDVTAASTLEEDVSAASTIEEDVSVASTIEEDVTAASTLEEDVTAASTLEEDVTAASTLEEDVSAASTIEEDVSAASTIEEDVSAASTIEEDVSAASTIEENVTAASALEDVSAASTIEEDVSAASTLEEDVSAASTTEDDVSAASTIEDVTAASTLEEDVTAASTIEEDVTAASTLEDVTAASTIEEDVTAASTIEEDVSAASALEDVTAASALEDDISAASTIEEDVTAASTLDKEEATAASRIEEDFTIFPLGSQTSKWALLTTTTGPQESLEDLEFSRTTPPLTSTAAPDASSSTKSTTASTTTTMHWTRRSWSPTTPTSRVFHKTTEPQKVMHLIPPVDQGLVDVEFSLTQPPTLLILPNERAAVGGTGKASDACEDDPCLNGGTCTERDGQVKCLCLPTYGGDLCQTDLEQCEPGWDKFHGFCYRHYSQRLSWEVAEQHCRMQGAHLVSILTPEEQNYINNNYKEYQWTGLNDKTIEDDFHWSDGNPLLYENWYRGQPDSYFLSGEDCVVMVWHDNGRWSDVPCNYHLAYTCKKGTSSCGPPPKVRNASIFGKTRQRYETNAVVRYHCAEGFQQRLTPLIRCLSGGMWERPRILCIPEAGSPTQHPEVTSPTNNFGANEDEFEATKERPQYWDIKF